jgi:hypothetical protein
MPSLPDIGVLVHAGLEQYYGQTGNDPLEYVANRGRELIEANPEYADQIFKDVEWALVMLQGYFDDWLPESGEDVGLEFVGAEIKTEAVVGPFILRGKIDGRVRRERDGALLQLENKTVGDLVSLPKWAQSAPQYLTYDLLAYLTRPDGVPTDGVLLNMLRRVKRTARAKPPFYGRHEVRHNVAELENHYHHIIGIGLQIQAARQRLDAGESHHVVCPPSASRNHGYSCSCSGITTMFDDGSDVEGYLAEFWEEHDPMERYEQTAEKPTLSLVQGGS